MREGGKDKKLGGACLRASGGGRRGRERQEAIWGKCIKLARCVNKGWLGGIVFTLSCALCIESEMRKSKGILKKQTLFLPSA